MGKVRCLFAQHYDKIIYERELLTTFSSLKCNALQNQNSTYEHEVYLATLVDLILFKQSTGDDIPALALSVRTLLSIICTFELL